MSDQQPRAEVLGEAGAKYREALIPFMAKIWGDMPSTAQQISHDRELELWERPTSPAAQQAFALGGDLATAQLANQQWANGMRAEQTRLRQSLEAQGVPRDQIPKQIQQAGLSDDAIFKACRKDAYEMGKTAAKDDPEREIDWHAKMAEKARAKRARPTYQTVEEERA